MSDPDDATQNLVLGAVGLAVALAVACVLAVAMSRGHRAAPPVGMAAPMASSADAGFGAVERIDFAPGASTLPPAARAAIGRVADAARLHAGATVLVSADVNTGGAALAEARVQGVRHALEADGVPPERVQRLSAAGITLGSSGVAVMLRP